jgi:hypothetical protein
MTVMVGRVPDILGKQECPEGEYRSLRTQQRAYVFNELGKTFLQFKNCCTDLPTFAACELVSVPPLSYLRETFARAEAFWTELYRAGLVLLRKEVIQPHLPVRLPCYDFVPIADPTFDGSLHKGWATGFGCYRLS